MYLHNAWFPPIAGQHGHGEYLTISPGLPVEFQGHPSGTWQPALFEVSVVQELLSTQFHTYLQRVKETDCQAELKRLLASGPPVHISDVHGLPLAEGDTHVSQLWWQGQEHSSILDGAKVGEEREKLWKDLREFVIVEGKEEGDDDEEDGAANESSWQGLLGMANFG